MARVRGSHLLLTGKHPLHGAPTPVCPWRAPGWRQLGFLAQTRPGCSRHRSLRQGRENIPRSPPPAQVWPVLASGPPQPSACPLLAGAGHQGSVVPEVCAWGGCARQGAGQRGRAGTPRPLLHVREAGSRRVRPPAVWEPLSQVAAALALAAESLRGVFWKPPRWLTQQPRSLAGTAALAGSPCRGLHHCPTLCTWHSQGPPRSTGAPERPEEGGPRLPGQAVAAP